MIEPINFFIVFALTGFGTVIEEKEKISGLGHNIYFRRLIGKKSKETQIEMKFR